MINQHESQYQSYLLRVWCDNEGEIWRIILEHVGTHERYGFTDFESLCAFLREHGHNVQTAHSESPDECRIVK